MTGSELREARKAKGLTQVALAGLVGVTQPTVAAWETDRTGISGPARKMLDLVLAGNGSGKVQAKPSKKAKRVN